MAKKQQNMIETKKYSVLQCRLYIVDRTTISVKFRQRKTAPRHTPEIPAYRRYLLNPKSLDINDILTINSATFESSQYRYAVAQRTPMHMTTRGPKRQIHFLSSICRLISSTITTTTAILYFLPLCVIGIRTQTKCKIQYSPSRRTILHLHPALLGAHSMMCFL